MVLLFLLKKEFKEAIKNYNLEKYDKTCFSVLVNLMKSKRINYHYLFSLTKKGSNEEVECVNYFNEIIKQNLINDIVKRINMFDFVKANIAPNIFGNDKIKEALAFFLLSDTFHILLLGDPGTGKTEFLKSVERLYYKTSFGLGSGVSKAGLTATVSKGQLVLGLLTMANNGICLIDELNLIKKEDIAGLYNAMEKGSITYTKGKFNETLPAKIKLLATANPKNDSFKENLKEQIPFGDALLSRFNLIFIMRKPNEEEFKKINEYYINSKYKNLEKDIAEKFNLDYELVKVIGLNNIVKEFIKHNEKKKVEVKNKQAIIDYISELRKKESHLVIRISPRITRGFLYFVEAGLRYGMSEDVAFEKVRSIFDSAFK